MNFDNQIERIQKAHDLICAEKTGSPAAFAAKLQISLNELYNDLDFFKQIHAEVQYSAKKETFYYKSNNFDFVTV